VVVWALSAAPAKPRLNLTRRAIDEQLVRLRRQLDKVVKTRACTVRAGQGAVPDCRACRLYQRR